MAAPFCVCVVTEDFEKAHSAIHRGVLMMATNHFFSHWPQALWRFCLHGLLACSFFVLILGPVPGHANAPPWEYASANGGAAAEGAGLVRFQANLERLRKRLDRSAFDLEALLDKLEYEPDKIARYMHRNIAFEPYAGLLRGPRGTLMSGAGNALDQAVLLAKLINDSGWQARIARTQLTDLQALKLLLEVRRPARSAPLMAQPGFRQAFQRLLADMGLSEEEIKQQIQALSQQPDFSQLPQFKKAEKNRALITAALENAGVPLASRNITPELLKRVKDYFWVEYRLDEGQDWKAAHPVFSSPEKAFQNLSKTEVLSDTVPQNLLHRVRFSAFLERRVGNKLEKERIFGPWEKPASNLYGLTIQYANIPDGIKKSKDAPDVLQIAKNTRFLLPTLTVANGKPQMANRLFDLSGVLVGKMAAADPMAGMIQTVGKKADKATSALAGLGSSGTGDNKQSKPSPPDRVREITAQWIELSLIGPDGKTKTLRRYLFDRLGPAQRAAGTVVPKKPLDEESSVWQLASPSSFLISPGRYADAYLIDRYVQNLDKLLPVLAEKKQHLSLEKLSQVIGEIHDHRPLQLAVGFDELQKNHSAEPTLRAYPAVVFLHNRFRLQKNTTGKTNPLPAQLQVRRIIDIAEYPDIVIQPTPLGILAQPQKTALLGTWATRVEQDGEWLLDPKAAKRLNVDIAFEKARKQGAHIAVFTDLKQFQSAPLKARLPAKSRAAIASDLQDGYAVVLPDKPAAEAIGWWRIDPESGESLGRIGEGLGGASTEYQIILHLVALKVATVLSIASYSHCMNSGGCSSAGCMRGAAASFGVSLLVIIVGGVIGAIWKSAAVATGVEIGSRAIGFNTLPGISSPLSPPSCIE